MKKSMSFSQRYERRSEILQGTDNDNYNLDRQLGAITQGNRKYRTWQTRIKEADNIIDNIGAQGSNIRSLERYYRDLSNELETNRSLAKDDSRKSYAQWHLERVGQKIRDLKDSRTTLSTKAIELDSLEYSQPQPVSVYDEARAVVATLTPETNSSLEETLLSSDKVKKRTSRFIGPLAAAASLALAGTGIIMATGSMQGCEIYRPKPRIYVSENGLGAGDALGIGLRAHARMLEEREARHSPAKVTSKSPIATTANAVVKEPLMVSYESERPASGSVASASILERAPFPFETEVADQGSSLIPDAGTLARYEAERANEQRVVEARKELAGRMYEGLKRGFAKIGDALRGLDAKVASMVPSVSSTPVYEAPKTAVASVGEVTPITTINIPSKPECGIITVARQYGLLHEKVENSSARDPLRLLGAGDALGTAIYLDAQIRKLQDKTDVKPEPVKAPSRQSSASLSYYGDSWQHEPSRGMEVLVKTKDKFNPLAVQVEVGNSGTAKTVASNQGSFGIVNSQMDVGTYDASLAQDPVAREKQIKEYDQWLTKHMKTFKPTPIVNGHY